MMSSIVNYDEAKPDDHGAAPKDDLTTEPSNPNVANQQGNQNSSK